MDALEAKVVSLQSSLDEAAAAISALMAERDALKVQIARDDEVDGLRQAALDGDAVKLREINVLAHEARTIEGISIALALQTIETLSRAAPASPASASQR